MKLQQILEFDVMNFAHGFVPEIGGLNLHTDPNLLKRNPPSNPDSPFSFEYEVLSSAETMGDNGWVPADLDYTKEIKISKLVDRGLIRSVDGKIFLTEYGKQFIKDTYYTEDPSTLRVGVRTLDPAQRMT